MTEAEKLVAEFKAANVLRLMAAFQLSLQGLQDTVAEKIYFADKVLHREDITELLNNAHRDVAKARTLLSHLNTEAIK